MNTTKDVFLDIQVTEDGELVADMTDGERVVSLNESSDPEIIAFLEGLARILNEYEEDE